MEIWIELQKQLKLVGYVHGIPDFNGQSQVINGVSDLFMEVFDEYGKHTRLAVYVSSLPYNVVVEVEGVFEIAETIQGN
ncbi:MAG: RidA family protein [Colwellia sp.]|nr:RidA family protein [Colwellia sp.]